MGAIFQADIWCDDCAAKIRDDIAADIFKRGDYTGPIGSLCEAWKLDIVSYDDIRDDVENLDERDYDSDECPKYYDESSESDCPEHCAGCHEFLENDLTSDGVDYVKETVREDIRSGHTDSIACTVWAPFYSWIDWEDIGYCDSCSELRDDLDSDGYCSGCVECYDSADCY